jgi:hypothetical protein
MAQSGYAEMICYLSAFGAKQITHSVSGRIEIPQRSNLSAVGY